MIRKKSFIMLGLLGMLSMFLLSGCGAGGGGGTDPVPPTPTPAAPATIVAGSVVDGFVAGATVQAYRINVNGTRGAAVGGSAVTGADGSYSLNLGTYTGPVMLETTGGNYVDWATGAAIALGVADKLSAVISSVVPGTPVTAMITPLTAMAAQRALQDIAINGTTVAAAIDTANADVGAYFGGFDILADKPINPTLAGSAGGVSQNSIDYGMILAGISRNASNKGLQPFSLVSAMITDAADGAFDGKQGATQLTVATTAGGTANLAAADAKGDLGAAITQFQTSIKNTSGGTVTPAITANLASATNPGTVFDKPNPPTSFTAVAASSSQIDLAWTASNGAANYNIYQNGSLKKSVSTTTASDSGLTASTNYCYQVSALDAAGNESTKSGQLCPTTLAAPAPAAIELLVSNPQLNSDGASTVTLSAVVKDGANRVLPGQNVSFTADSGTLIVTKGITDDSGTATATLGTPGNPANRTINLTAATGSLNAANTVSVVGTTIGISGLASLSLGAQTDLTIFLSNSAGVGLAGKTMTVTSVNGNTIALPVPPNTNASGQITARVTASVSGDDVITASALGATKTFSLSVNPSVLVMTAPLTGAEVAIGANQPVSVRLTNAGAPVSGATINFMTTRGAVSSATAVTALDGTASVNVSSTTVGPAMVSAFVTGGASVQTAIEFVALTPVKMKLQAEPTIIGTNSGGATTEKSLLTATLRDANDNLVKGKTVNFTLTQDVSGGYLSPASATTDSSGTATVYYIAGASSTGLDGVKISATVAGYPAVIASTTLTVSQKAVSITLGTGPEITSPSNLLYRQDYLALVTSNTGAPIPGVAVTATLVPQYYTKGYYIISGSKWQQVPTLVAASSTKPDVPACANEDGITHNPLYDFNGQLDTGEDQNNNARLDPGNIASVTATVTDSNGFSTISITYAKDYAYWANVRLVVRASAEGSNTSAAADFDLPGAASDFSNITVAPPGFVSPFGVSISCFDTKPSAPTNVTAAAASSTQINLSWTASAGAAGYKIYRDGAAINTVTAVTAVDSGLTSGTQYCYQVSAFDSTGSESDKSAQICVTTPTLAPPTNPTVAAVNSSQINISWTGSAGAAGYRIYKDGVTVSYWRSVVAPTVSVSDTGLAAGVQHCYQIAAHDAAGIESAKTGQVCATTTALEAPTNLTVTAVSSSQIDLSWTAAGGVGYRIYRAGAHLKDVAQTSTSDTGLSPNSFYCYTVAVLDGANNASPQSSQLCTTTYGPPPAVPSGLVAKATGPTQVDLSWTGSIGASQYKIYRNGVLLTATTSTTYSDLTAAANTQYTYTVTAIDATGSESGGAGQSLAHTGLTVPSGVTATVNSSSQITLTWTDSGGALVTGYKVYKGGALLGAVAPKTATSIVDGGLDPNTQYCYSVSSTGTAGGESAKSGTVCGTTQPPPVAASVDLLVSSPQLNSDGASTVTLTAVVKDTDNRALSGQTVTFTADSGLLTVVDPVTNASGTATATLGTGGDRANRVINLTASTAGINAANTVTVTGTTISISGSASLSFGDAIPLTIFLKDSAGTGIAGKTLVVTSEKGNTLSPGRITDANGQLILTVTAVFSGPDKITASAIGAEKTFDLTVNAKILRFTSPAPPPAAVTEIPIGAPGYAVSVTYTEDGNPIANVPVNFVTTRGVLSAATALTNASGVATVNASATNSGPVLFLASVTGGPSAQVAAEYVATTVNSVILQAAPNTIGTNSGGLTNEKSLITAVVRDANNNLVKGKAVDFNIVNDASGGSLTPASAITDSSGTASTYFIAGSSTSALNGVTIRGTVSGTAVSAITTLTVAQKALFVTLATGPFISEMADKIRYQKDYVALVTDAAGDPVAGATVVATVTPVHYQKGYYVWGGSRWNQVVTLQPASTTLPGVPACANEDGMLHNSLYDFNGVLDTDPGSGAKEDQNGNGVLDPGNMVSVTSTTTDAAGHSTLRMVYAKNYAAWVNVKLTAIASTAGSTASASQEFYLPGLATEYTQENTNPPGNPSPFGISTSCFVDLTVSAISSSQMSVTWQKSADAASYNVYRGGANVGNTTLNTFTDSGLAAATEYCYQIKTVNGLGIESGTVFAGPVCGRTNAVTPATPTGLEAAPEALPTNPVTYGIRLTWDDPASEPAVYRIYRDGQLALSAIGSVTTVVDAGVLGQTDYCYTISALEVGGSESAQSTPVCTATP